MTDTDPRCRLCGAVTGSKFALRPLSKHDSSSWRCTRCTLLQTDPPAWLAEANASRLSILDTFAAQRRVTNLAASFVTARVLGLRNVIDFGGCDGIRCGRLSNYGLNCYIEDRYAEPKYAQGFDVPELTLAFEVLQHLPNPRVDLDEEFSGDRAALLMSTAPYLGESPAWAYLAPETVQQKFFYSASALRTLATKRGDDLQYGGAYTLLTRPALMRRARALRLLFGRHTVRAVRMLLNLVPATMFWRSSVPREWLREPARGVGWPMS